MTSFKPNKLFILLLALTGVIALGVLASGIQNMDFREPDPLYFEWPTMESGSFQTAVKQLDAIPIEQIILFWTITVVLTLVFILILNPRYRWQILRAVIRGAIVFISLTWALKAIAEKLNEVFSRDNASGQDGLSGFDSSALPVYHPLTDVPWISYIFSLAIVVGAILLGWWVWKSLGGARSRHVRDAVVKIARETLGELSDGRDFSDAVTSCYIRMNEVASANSGLNRQTGMTPSEFAVRLEAAGLPGSPVRRLTRLFESVRYGAKKPGDAETREAVTCLNEIVSACGGNA